MASAAAPAAGRLPQSPQVVPPASAPAPPPATSEDLIDQALAAKSIDAETAHKYRVFAAFGDSRLPARYRGNNAGGPEPSQAVAAAGALLGTFSAQTQADLAPFFMRPDEPGSWVTLESVAGLLPTEVQALAPNSGGWQSFPAVGGRAKVWAQNRYQGDAAKAEALAAALTTLIWKKLDDVMGPAPATDAGLAHNGGDGALDFYLVHAPKTGDIWAGFAPAADPRSWCGPSRYIMIDSQRPLVGNAKTNGILEIAAHELMHAIEFAYPTGGDCAARWIMEASATWAENFVYPRPDSEHSFAEDFLDTPDRSINEGTTYPKSRIYGAYLLPYFREMTGSDGPQFMHKIWDNMTTMDDLAAVDAVLDSGFEKTWPKFLIQNWNRPSVPSGYRGWDRLATGARPFGMKSVKEPWTPMSAKAGPAIENITFGFGLPYLAGQYRHFVFDGSVKSVLFRNTVAEEGMPHTTVWAIEKIGGTWKAPVDWTKEFQKAWCRDEADQDLEELVVIFGNSDWKDKKSLNPAKESSVKVYPTGCTSWVGTVTATYTQDEPTFGAMRQTATTSVRFEVDPDQLPTGGPPEYWILTEGSMAWTVSATGGACTGNFAGGIALKLDSTGNHPADLRIWDAGNPVTPPSRPVLRYNVVVGPVPDQSTPQLTFTCKGRPAGAPEMKLAPIVIDTWFGNDPDGHNVSQDGKMLEDTYETARSPIARERWTWTLHPSP